MVKLFIKNFRFKNGHKLISRYILIKIIAKVGSQVYKVRLPEKYYRIYNVVLVLFLELWTAPHDLEKTPFLDLKDDQEVYEPESIEIHIDTAKGRQYFIKWRGWPVNYNI